MGGIRDQAITSKRGKEKRRGGGEKKKKKRKGKLWRDLNTLINHKFVTVKSVSE